MTLLKKKHSNSIRKNKPLKSAFVPSRLIMDNILTVYECFHTIKKKNNGKEGLCAIKLDMHKAYDRVEWIFLETILLRLGFTPNWVAMIMECVRTMKYQVRVNNVLTDFFVPSRGL